MVLASSGQVVWWQRFRGPLPVKDTDLPSPRSWYAACKLFMEGAGQSYAELHGMEVIAVRLGWCPRTPEHVTELAATTWGPDVYLSPGDAGRFFASAVEAPLPRRFIVVYATSRPPGTPPYDLTSARELLAYEPRDRWPEGVESIT